MPIPGFEEVPEFVLLILQAAGIETAHGDTGSDKAVLVINYPYRPLLVQVTTPLSSQRHEASASPEATPSNGLRTGTRLAQYVRRDDGSFALSTQVLLDENGIPQSYGANLETATPELLRLSSRQRDAGVSVNVNAMAMAGTAVGRLWLTSLRYQGYVTMAASTLRINSPLPESSQCERY